MHKLPHEGDAHEFFSAYLKAFDRQKDEVLQSLGREKP